jgi:hypothetical protein
VRELGDDAGLAMGILAGTVDVGVAEDGVLQPVILLVEIEVMFECVFANAVFTDRVDGMIFVHGEVDRFTIDRRGGDVDKVFDLE